MPRPTPPTIYQVTDMTTSKRLDFVAEARAGGARLRDKDGMSLLLLPESQVTHLQSLQEHIELFLVVERQAATVTPPDVYALGRHAWIRSLPAEDLIELAADLSAAIIASIADQDSLSADRVVEEWRLSASQLDDPLRRAVLLDAFDATDYLEADQPDDAEAIAGVTAVDSGL